MSDSESLLSGSPSGNNDTPGGAEPDLTAQKERFETLGEFLRHAGDSFDPAVLIACRRYMKAHEADRLAAQHVAAQEMLTSEDFAVMTWREKIHMALAEPFRSRIGRAILTLEVLLVALTLVAIVFESLPRYQPDIFEDQVGSWTLLDGIVSNLFLLELIVTIAVYPPPRRRVIVSWRTLIDVISILPFFVQLFVNRKRRNILGMLKALRVMRLAKLLLHINSFLVILLAMKRAFRMLMAPLAACLMVIVLLSSAVYFAERGQWDATGQRFVTADCRCELSSEYVLGLRRCPQVESKHFSIMHTMWLLIQTVTTVGYGDTNTPMPECPVGKVLTIGAMLFGSLALSMPIAVVGSYYSILEFEKQERVKELRKVKSTVTSQSSFMTLSDGDLRETLAALGAKADAARREGPQSAGKALCKFLRDNVKAPARTAPADVTSVDYADFAMAGPAHVKTRAERSGSALHYFNMYHPHPEIMFYLDVYLSDYAEELAIKAPESERIAREVGQLVPAGAAAKHDPSADLDAALGQTVHERVAAAAQSRHFANASRTVQFGAVKDHHEFVVERFDRVSDDVFSDDAQRAMRARARVPQTLASSLAAKGAHRLPPPRPNALPPLPAQAYRREVALDPGLYTARTVARVVLTYAHRSTAEAEADPATQPGIACRPVTGGTMSDRYHASHHAAAGAVTNRVGRCVIAFPRAVHELGVATSGQQAFRVEPFSAKSAAALPGLLARALGIDRVQDAATATRGIAQSKADFVGERQLFNGTVVAVDGVSYQYLEDEADMRRVQRAYACRLEALWRGHRKAVSQKLYGMPLPSSTAQGSTHGDDDGQHRGGRSPVGLRRRGTSPEYAETSPSPSRRGGRLGAAASLRELHTTPSGDLQMPFLSRVATRAATGVAHSRLALDEEERKRRKRASPKPQ